MVAQTPRARAIWARRGLAAARRLDRTTQSMLLRQLYLAYYEERRFEKALEISEQNLHLEVLPDVVHQDAARAAHALGDIDGARRAPAARGARRRRRSGARFTGGRWAACTSSPGATTRPSAR